ncbi:hypothetical protein GCM10010371_24900 [Streptomyces subrutilus]|uniref:Uncharacterized protein n=1 Tax=Streptomyces subrutilus TaxID=36818 RepID=A0A918V4Q6_9ACTN|nr:hypothetical protein GCM10010371_24900 [Streptomyces subrutilus]
MDHNPQRATPPYGSGMRYFSPTANHRTLGLVRLGVEVRRGRLPVVGPRALDHEDPARFSRLSSRRGARPRCASAPSSRSAADGPRSVPPHRSVRSYGTGRSHRAGREAGRPAGTAPGRRTVRQAGRRA